MILVSPFRQHGAIRTTLSGPADYVNDDESGFQRIEAREIDTIGAWGTFPASRRGPSCIYASRAAAYTHACRD